MRTRPIVSVEANFLFALGYLFIAIAALGFEREIRPDRFFFAGLPCLLYLVRTVRDFWAEPPCSRQNLAELGAGHHEMVAATRSGIRAI